LNLADSHAALPASEIAEFCRRRGVRELYVFGSILGDAFPDESDVDVMMR
jgi:predicted nucleotidyltransferase